MTATLGARGLGRPRGWAPPGARGLGARGWATLDVELLGELSAAAAGHGDSSHARVGLPSNVAEPAASCDALSTCHRQQNGSKRRHPRSRRHLCVTPCRHIPSYPTRAIHIPSLPQARPSAVVTLDSMMMRARGQLKRLVDFRHAHGVRGEVEPAARVAAAVWKFVSCGVHSCQHCPST